LAQDSSCQLSIVHAVILNRCYLNVFGVLPGAVDDVLRVPPADLGEILSAVPTNRATCCRSFKTFFSLSPSLGESKLVSAPGKTNRLALNKAPPPWSGAFESFIH
jgi:hypothetical protein